MKSPFVKLKATDFLALTLLHLKNRILSKKFSTSNYSTLINLKLRQETYKVIHVVASFMEEEGFSPLFGQVKPGNNNLKSAKFLDNIRYCLVFLQNYGKNI